MRRVAATAGLVAALSCGVAGGAAPAHEAEATFSRAIQAFDDATSLALRSPAEAQRRYAAARDGFAALVSGGIESGPLLYNLGNTYVMLGELGRAIACYRRAERLIPGDASLKENLRFARSKCSVNIPPPATHAVLRTLLFLHYGTSLRARAQLGIVAYVAFWALMAAGLARARSGPWVRWGRWLSGAVAASLAISVACEWGRWGARPAGVLVRPDVTVRKGNGESYEAAFNHPLGDGVEFVLVEPPRGEWVHVELADGTGGWVRRQEVELLDPA
ncbi:MAG: tetratricopeptide repeat protein [Phycisphaerae bacterium]